MINRSVLIQEERIIEPYGEWRILTACIMLNMTSYKQVDPILELFLTKWPTPYHLDSAEETLLCDVVHTVKPLGMGMKRACNLIDMSKDFIHARDQHGNDFHRYPVMEFHGCGRYANDAWMLFVLKQPCKPKDKRLIDYAKRKGLYKEGL